MKVESKQYTVSVKTKEDLSDTLSREGFRLSDRGFLENKDSIFFLEMLGQAGKNIMVHPSLSNTFDFVDINTGNMWKKEWLQMETMERLW